MKSFGFWTPVIVSLVVTPVALLLGIGSAGAGHGDYFWAQVLFPYTMLSTFLFQSITIPFIVLAIAQFPLYGLLLAFAHERKQSRLVAIGLAVVHITAAALCLFLVYQL
jgi:hypothetical protein